MRRFIKGLILCGIVASFSIMPSQVLEVNAAQNNVPDYYYANYKFIDDWNQIRDIFDKMTSRFELGMDISPSYLENLVFILKDLFHI